MTAPTDDLRDAVALTRTQFIIAMAVEIGKSGNLPAGEPLRLASRAYHAFEDDTGASFGDPEHAWDQDAARIIAREYETAHWEDA
ncbi:hypothetical protein ASG40_11470 [Methylobacterium sp. Leaf399]|uniref:hypothetical protein n=1 Tax=Methylobacterium sp. Leaf399 TaxID=1736364 RepID=UPI00070223F7|nr:hypothetical protein [Methylobacterium sp. Leaf399]KQT08493.1 hypothetical protein ASG40_11470 [Methylobacterium sp. Leaf399]